MPNPHLITDPVKALTAVKQNGYDLQLVPDSLKTESLCLVAVERNLGTILYVPDHLYDKIAALVK